MTGTCVCVCGGGGGRLLLDKSLYVLHCRVFYSGRLTTWIGVLLLGLGRIPATVVLLNNLECLC